MRLLGEDLVLFRDLSGRYGLLDRHCPHRRADLSYGYVEKEGIRCNYHGWMMDDKGGCVEQPFEDTFNPKSPLRKKCTSPAYPVRESGRPAVGLHGARPGARTAGMGSVHVEERLRRDRLRGSSVQLVPVPGKLDRSGALRMDA